MTIFLPKEKIPRNFFSLNFLFILLIEVRKFFLIFFPVDIKSKNSDLEIIFVFLHVCLIR